MTTGPPIPVPLDLIRFRVRAWPREYLDSERVEDFAALYQEHGPSVLPEPELVADGRSFFLIGDGVHRIEAARLAGLKVVLARVLVPPAGADPVEFAYRHALDRCAFTSRPLSRSEKQTAVRRLLTEYPDGSDREIARLVGVDHKTVGRIRRGDSPGRAIETLPAGPSPEAVAKRLFRGFEKAYEARGLGVSDFFVGDRTGERLASVLAEVYGEQALAKAEQFHGWIEQAVAALERPQ